MKKYFCTIALMVFGAFLAEAKPIKLSDGKTFNGWNGETNSIWRIEKGAFVGGSLEKRGARNEFLCTDRNFTNFVLRLKFKLVGTNGFVNGGVQFRSQRVPNDSEASGYQADIGDPSWWGCLYDESRRNKVLVQAPTEEVKKVLKHDDWNDYMIRCEGKHIQLSINGVKTVDYMEADEAIPGFGIIGLQIHGGGMSEAWYKNITVEELPDVGTEATNTPPMTIYATEEGWFAKGSPWVLEMKSDRSAHIRTSKYPKDPNETAREFTVPKEKVEEIRAALVKEDFLNLSTSYGDMVPDGSTCMLRITLGKQEKTVKLLFLPNIKDLKAIEETKRAVRVWILVRGLFDDISAVDTRRYDELFLKSP